MRAVNIRKWELGVFGAAVILDQLSKGLVSWSMELGVSIDVLGRFFRLTYIRNPRAAFGIAIFGGTLHLVFSLIALVLILFILYKTPLSQRGARIALSLILGGAIGNLIDRLRMGEVIDFFDFGIGQDRWRWPVFNGADIAITVGVFLILFSYIRDSAVKGQEANS